MGLAFSSVAMSTDDTPRGRLETKEVVEESEEDTLHRAEAALLDSQQDDVSSSDKEEAS